MKRACVVGWPIEHSRSPLIHGTWIARYGIEGSYIRQAVRPGEAAAFFARLSDHGFVGCNVTLPHKEAAFVAAHEKKASAVAVGAANTLWLEDGRLCAANTDTYGFMAHLAASAPRWADRDAPVAILGAGGAARAIVYGFLGAGVQEVRIFNRTLARAEEIAAHFGNRVRALTWEARNAHAADCSVIVNTTTLGMKGEGDPGIDFTACRAGAVAADIVYVPLMTQFLEAAERAGLTPVDGLGMLLHQAVPGFEKWFGVRPQVTEDLRALVVADIVGQQG
jgi:shikimate dehydrogenase